MSKKLQDYEAKIKAKLRDAEVGKAALDLANEMRTKAGALGGIGNEALQQAVEILRVPRKRTPTPKIEKA